MPLKIVTGRAGSGKSSFCISKISEIAKAGGKVIYIVPKQYTHEAESQLIEKVGFISDSVRAISFTRLSLSVLKTCGKAGVYADNRVKCMLMAKTLLELGKNLKVFSAASKNSGFVQVILDVISEFKKAALLPDDIIACSEKITDNDYFAQKMSELGQIYKKYTESFSENLIDSQDSVTMASECIENSDILKGTYIFIDEFFKFTKQEIMFITALFKQKCDVTVAITCDEKNAGGVFDAEKATCKRLIDACKNAGDSFLGYTKLENPKRFISNEILHLEREITNYPPKKYEEKTEDINLFVAPDIYSEITEVASKISRMVKQSDISYSDISILAGNFERYADIVANVFEDYEIPVFIDNKKSILNHPIMLMLFTVFDIITDGFKTQDILTYIKTGLSPISAIEADILENHVISAGVKYADWLDDVRFALKAKSVFDTENELTEEEKAQLLDIKNRVIGPIVNLKNKLSQSRKVSKRITAFIEFFEETDLYGKIVLLKDELEKKGDRHSATEYASVYNILGETFAQTAEYMADSQMGMERLKEVLSAGFGDLSISVVPTECEQVLFADESRSVVKNVCVLFIMGANSGAFPPEISSGGIFSDQERIFLESQGFELLSDSEKRIFDARFMVYNTLSVPKEKLYISYSLADIDGKGLRPSQLIGNLTRIFPSLTTSYGKLSGEMPKEHILSPKSAFNYVVGNFASNNENPLTKALAEELSKNRDFNERLMLIRNRIKAEKRAERLNQNSINGLYGKRLLGSVSRFEQFSECPFSYFVKFGLRAKVRKAVTPEATDTGSLLHEVIEIFSKNIYNSGRLFKDITDDECREEISKIIDELISGSFIEKIYSPNKLKTFVRRLKSLATRSALAILEHIRRGKFEPCAFEFSFDENGDTPPIKLSLPNGAELSIIGKIDRVDSFKSGDNIYIKIIDYKSGRKKFSLQDVYNRLSLQLTVYLTAYIGADSKRQPAGMFYFKLTDPVTDAQRSVSKDEISEEIIKKYKMSGLVLSEEEIVDALESDKTGYFATIPIMRKKDGSFSEGFSSCATKDEFKMLTEYVNKALCDIGNEIFSGNTDISPIKNGKQTACDYCEFSSICGAGKYVDVEFRNALTLNKPQIFSEMKRDLEENE